MNKKAIVSIINVMIQNINSEAAQRDFAKGAFLAKESVLSGNPVPSLEGEERIYEWMAGDILTAIKNGKNAILELISEYNTGYELYYSTEADDDEVDEKELVTA